MTTITRHSRLLIPEYPLQLLPSLAVKVGLQEAIILQQVHYWASSPKAIEREGHHWVYNSYTDWQKQFPFLSVKQIGTAIRNLEAQGYLISENFNSRAIDRTKWYRIDHAKLDEDLDDDYPHRDDGRTPGDNGDTPRDNGGTSRHYGDTPRDDQRTPRDALLLAETTTETTTETTAEREGARSPAAKSSNVNRAELHAKYDSQPELGGYAGVEKRITKALNHVSKNVISLQVHCDQWLQDDVDLGNPAALARGRARPAGLSDTEARNAMHRKEYEEERERRHLAQAERLEA